MVKPSNKVGSHSSKRKKKDVVGNMVDRISELPDEILVSIVSLLPLKEAQATSILAKRWHYLWAYRTNLNFYDDKNLFRLGKIDRFSDFGSELVEFETNRFVNWVNSVLKQHRALNIEQFKVCFNLECRSCFDEWIRLAMRKGVQVLELDFSKFPGSSEVYKKENYIFSNKRLGISKNYIGFKCLKDLNLKCVNVDSEVLEHFMINCPALERLAVSGRSSLSYIRVVGQTIALKHLAVRSCGHIHIEIRDANLVTLSYDRCVRDLVLSNVPLLVEVSILDQWDPAELRASYFQLSGCFSQLESFCRIAVCESFGSNAYRIRDPDPDPAIPSLPNLKRLEIVFKYSNNYALLDFASYIKKSPYIRTLVLLLSGSWSKESPFAKKRAAKFSHDCLKLIKIVEYTGQSRQVELVKYLTKTASNLEKIVFDPVNPWSSRLDRLQDQVVEEEELSRAKALLLKKKLPATLEVVCL